MRLDHVFDLTLHRLQVEAGRVLHRQDPFERLPVLRGETFNTGSPAYVNDFMAREFWRFVLVQQQVGKLAATAIDYPRQARRLRKPQAPPALPVPCWVTGAASFLPQPSSRRANRATANTTAWRDELGVVDIDFSPALGTGRQACTLPSCDTSLSPT